MPSRLPIAVACQIVTVVSAIVGAALWPPEHGTMLLVPVSGQIAGPVDAAMAGGASLVGNGPLPGSLVVLGDRRAIATAALDHGILIVSAPRTLCGEAQSSGAAA
ncbi:MAG: hypothetical protein V4537_17565 [Pseudomonadota bacterium]